MSSIRGFLKRRKYLKRRDSVTKKKVKKGWFSNVDIETREVYYSVNAPINSLIHICGPGDRKPTPQEIYDEWKKHPGSELDTAGLFVHEYDIENEAQERVDLPAGCYHYKERTPRRPECLISTELRTDTMIKMPGITRSIIKDVQAFFDNEKVYRDVGIQYRRGILLYGDPGNGKTCSLREIVKEQAPKDAIVIFLNSLPTMNMIKKLQAEKRMKIIIFEELVAIISQNDVGVDRILDFLDGESSLDNALIFATTNYPEKLPGNIVDRPSRFDRLIKVGNPNVETCKQLLALYLSREATETEIKVVTGLSVAAIKEVCIMSRIHNISLDKAADKMRQTKELVKKDFEESSPIGLTNKRNRFFSDLEEF
jgi:hypothetical protein